MNFIHYKNDFTIDINLSSITTGLTIDPDVIYSIKFYTRKNGTSYKCCYMNNTLVKHDGYVTAVLNQPCLEPGVLHYIVEYQINDSTYPDAHKRIFQEFTSDIELCKGNGDTLEIDVQAMFGDTIDNKFNSYDASILALGTATTALNASILSITQKNSIQDASINRIEEVIATIDGGTSGSIDRLNTSVNAL